MDSLPPGTYFAHGLSVVFILFETSLIRTYYRFYETYKYIVYGYRGSKIIRVSKLLYCCH